MSIHMFHLWNGSVDSGVYSRTYHVNLNFSHISPIKLDQISQERE